MDQPENIGNNQTENGTPEQEAKIVFEPVYEPPIVMKSTKMTEEMQETANFKRTATFCGVAFLAMYLLLQAVNFIPKNVMLRLGVTPVKIIEILNDPVVLQIEQIVFSTILLTLPFVLVFKLGKFKIGDIVAFRLPKDGHFFDFVIIGAAFCVLANIAASYMAGFFGGIGINYDYGPIETPSGTFGFVLSFISTVILPALLEEFACRGIIFGALKKYGEGVAVLGSAAMFGLMHGNFEQIPFAFFVGLVLGYVTAKSGSVLPAMAIHAWNNFVSFLFTDIIGFLSEDIINLIYSILIGVILLAAVASMVRLFSKGFDYGLCENGSKLKLKEKCKMFFFNPTVVVYAVICFIKAWKYFV